MLNASSHAPSATAALARTHEMTPDSAHKSDPAPQVSNRTSHPHPALVASAGCAPSPALRQRCTLQCGTKDASPAPETIRLYLPTPIGCTRNSAAGNSASIPSSSYSGWSLPYLYACVPTPPTLPSFLARTTRRTMPGYIRLTRFAAARLPDRPPRDASAVP